MRAASSTNFDLSSCWLVPKSNCRTLRYVGDVMIND
jgi:hypothetical protein